MSGANTDQLQVLAHYQAGMVSRRQALDCGMSPGMIDTKIHTGRWRAVHRGVYVTHDGPLTRSAQLWAAVLSVGRSARLSHESAAEALGLTDKRWPQIHVSVDPNRRVAPVEGVTIHISADNGKIWRPPLGTPPYTTAEDTVLDLADAATSLDDVIGWVTRALAARPPLTDQYRLRTAMAKRKKLRWRRELGEVLTAAAGGTHSVLEYRHDRDVQRAHGLPAPGKQVPFTNPGGKTGYLDRYYKEYRLLIELDGRQYHPDEKRAEDQARDNASAVTGATLRYGWYDVTRRACEVARQEADALRSRGWADDLKPCSPTCRAVYPLKRPEPTAKQIGDWPGR